VTAESGFIGRAFWSANYNGYTFTVVARERDQRAAVPRAGHRFGV
jgi:hypothetical protein